MDKIKRLLETSNNLSDEVTQELMDMLNGDDLLKEV